MTSTKAINFVAIMQIEEDAYCFTIPDLPGFTAQIDTDEATDLAEVKGIAEDVLAEHLGALIDAGKPLPTPRSLGIIDVNWVLQRRKGEDGVFIVLTGRPRATAPTRFNVSMDSSTLSRIDEAAKARGMTRSAYLAEAALAYG